MAFDDATLVQIAALLAESSDKIQTWAFIQSCLNELVEAHEEGLVEQLAQQELDDSEMDFNNTSSPVHY